MANGHGRRRPGAGRKPGSPNVRRVNEIVREALERGESPLEYFLSIMADTNEPTQRRDWAASQAAPFCHPRLQAVEQNTHISGDPLAEILKVIDGRTTEIDSGKEPFDGSSLAPVKPVSHH